MLRAFLGPQALGIIVKGPGSLESLAKEPAAGFTSGGLESVAVIFRLPSEERGKGDNEKCESELIPQALVLFRVTSFLGEDTLASTRPGNNCLPSLLHREGVKNRKI